MKLVWFSMVVKLVVVIHLAVQACFAVDECFSPVAYNDTRLVIFGPCPEESFVIPLKSTGKFQCDYTNTMATGPIFPFWTVSPFAEDPIFSGMSTKHFAVSSMTNQNSGYTILTINTNGLNETASPIYIRCGICLSVTCPPAALEKGKISDNSSLIVYGN